MRPAHHGCSPWSLASERPGQREHRAPRRHAARQGAEDLRVETRDLARPLRILDHAVRLAGQVRREAIEAHAVALQESLIVQPLAEQGVGEPEQHCGIGARSGRQPLRLQEIGRIGAHRADVHELHPRVTRLAHVVTLPVPPGAAHVDLGVLERQAAEGHEQVGMLDDRRPGGVLSHHRREAPEHVGENHFARRQAVGISLRGEAAGAVQETVELALAVMESPRAAPSVGAAVDRSVAELGDDAPEFLGHEPLGGFPGHRHERLAPPCAAIGASTGVEPPLSHHRLGDPARVAQGVEHAFGDRRRVVVSLVAVERDELAVLHLGAVGAPVRGGDR